VICKWLNELKQIIANDARAAKTTKTYANQKTEDIIQMQNKMQNELTKEEDKSAGLQSTLLALKEDIRSTPTYASVTRSSQQAQRIQRTKKTCPLCTNQQQREVIKGHKRRTDK
jgi:hypothetical protein